MAQITGYVELEITYNNGTIEFDQVDGDEFGLEEGGDHTVDREDGEIAVGYLYIAFRDAYDVILTANYHGGNNLNFNVSIRSKDFISHDIQSVVIIDTDQIDIENP